MATLLKPNFFFRTRLQWMSSLRTAIEYAEEPVRYQRSLFEKRKLGRQDEKEKEDEEFERIMTMNNDTLNDTQLQLEQEKQVSFIEKNALYYIEIKIEILVNIVRIFYLVHKLGSSSCGSTGPNITKTTSD